MIATPLQLVFWTLVGLAIVLGSSLLAYGKGFKEGKTLGISIGFARAKSIEVNK